MAVKRLKHEGLAECPEVTEEGSRFYKDPAGYALTTFAYYSCFKCQVRECCCLVMKWVDAFVDVSLML